MVDWADKQVGPLWIGVDKFKGVLDNMENTGHHNLSEIGYWGTRRMI
jgi:hypothetical protein